MLSLVMKLPVQTPSGKASCPLTRTPLLLNTPFPSYYIPVTLVPSLTYALFFVTLARIARQGRQSEVPSRHRLRTAVPPSRHPFRSLFSPCCVATPIRSTR